MNNDMRSYGFSLSGLVDHVQHLRQVRTSDLSRGDQVFVKTSNSVYTIRMLNDRQCIVSGGWFDRKGLSPMQTRINGCTWGGSAIKIDIVAACGLCLEFGNRLVTSPIQKILILPHESGN